MSEQGYFRLDWLRSCARRPMWDAGGPHPHWRHFITPYIRGLWPSLTLQARIEMIREADDRAVAQVAEQD